MRHLPAVLLAVILEICRTLFTVRTGKQGLTRSAVFLISFVIVHAIGNGIVFAGKDAFNAYGAVLHSVPIIPAVEAYLAGGFLLHAVTAGYLTLTSKFKRKALTPGNFNANVAALALSGSVLLGFLVWHVLEFRFGADYRTPEGHRDLYTLQVEVFGSAPKVALYEVAVVALGVHLWKGWRSAVRALPGIESEQKGTALLLGQALAALLCGVFAACPVFVHVQGQ